MGNPRRFRKITAVLVLWVALAAACNLPARVPYSRSISAQETLIATLFPESEISTPQPGSTQVAPFSGLRTPVPLVPPLTQEEPAGNVYSYVAQPGDTLAALAQRFQVPPEYILSDFPIPSAGLIDPGQLLVIPNINLQTGYSFALMPDSEIVYSPTALDFDIAQAIQNANGFLAGYREDVEGVNLSSAEIVRRVALEESINPRILLAFLEYRSHWLSGQISDSANIDFPIGFMVPQYRGLYKELILTGRQLTIGYYGWRAGALTELKYADGSTLRLHPEINAGTAAIQYLFSVVYNPPAWNEALYGQANFFNFYTPTFGDPWQRDQALGPLLPAGLQQPPLELPFAAGEAWSLTGGPHMAYGIGSARGALDFAPVKKATGCIESDAWVTAAAAGRVVRSENGSVVIDLDLDGYEQTGWSIYYLHIATHDRIPVGSIVAVDQPIGHPSCEGGVATGTHVHISRKYNGEWLSAGPPVPFVMSGWQATLGEKAYQGQLFKGSQIVIARPDGSSPALIIR